MGTTTRSPGNIALVVLGVLAAFLGLAVLGAGGALLGLGVLRSDANGFVPSHDVALSTPTNALVSEQLALWADVGPGDWTPGAGDVTARLAVTADDGGPVFVGVGPAGPVDAWLADVDHEVVTDIGPDGVTTRREPGATVPDPPASTDLWAASAVGSGTQQLTWDIATGEWRVVVMDADGSAGVAVVATAGLRIPWLVPIGIGLLVAAALVLVVAVLLLAAGATPRRGPRAGRAPAAPGSPGPYPARLTAALDPRVSRWQWLVKWFLAIPHLVVLALLWVAFAVSTVAAGVSILVTRRYPRGLFDFDVGVLRWSWRVTYYAFGVLGTDRYPPFTLARTDYPADFDVDYPEEGLSRGLVLVKWWLLAIPQYLVVGVLTGGVVSWGADVGVPEGWQVAVGGGLVGLLSLVAVVVLAVRGTYPRELFDLLVGLQRWVYRVAAYAALMTDAYPPFRLDTGGDEHATAPPPPAPAAPSVAAAPPSTVA